MDYKIESIDLSSKRKQRIFDFFVSSLIEPIKKARECKKIKLLPYFQKEGEQGEHFLALYLAGALTKFVFYDDCLKEIENLEKLTKEYESNLFYNYSLCKCRGDQLLVNRGLFYKNYYEFTGSRFYFIASQLKFKLDRKATPTSLILRNLCFYFKEFADILKESIPTLSTDSIDKFYK